MILKKKILGIIEFWILLFIQNTIFAGQPPLIATLPKSGTVYIRQTVADLMGRSPKEDWTYRVMLPGVKRSAIYGLQLDETQVENFLNSSGYSVNHFGPSKENVAVLKKCGAQILVEVRDPREALLSWTIYLDTFEKNYLMEHQRCYWWELPENYCSLTFEEKIDHQIEKYYRFAIDWLTGWEAWENDLELNLKIVTIEELRNNPVCFF